MALEHARALETIDVRPLGSAWIAARSHSLLKTQHLQLMRLLLRRGEALPEHHVPGEITIHCLEGEASVGTPSHEVHLLAGQLVMLPGGVAHTVTALADASLLVTVLLEPEADRTDKLQTANRKSSTEGHPR